MTATAVIGPFRTAVAGHVAKTDVPTYGYLPDDPAHLPCYVVGRPSMREAAQTAVMTMSVDVTLLGRRIANEDSQAELDALADQLFINLGGTRSVRVGDVSLRLTLMLPGTAFVAGNEYPAYVVTVTTDTMNC